MSLLTLSSVTKSYGAVRAVDDVSLPIDAGSRTVIVGRSGSGKTSLLRLIAGFEMPDAGSVRLNGRLLAGDGARVPAHQRGIGYVTQDGALFPHLTAAGNIAFGLTVDAVEKQRRVHELLSMVGLDAAVGERRPDQLSGGQQQRIALARALALQPKLMLLDEPFSALDAGLRDATRRAVSDVLAAAGVTSILVTHDHHEALSFADQVAVLSNGKLAQFGPPQELYWHPQTREIAILLGDAIILEARISGRVAHTALGELSIEGTPVERSSAYVMLRPEQVEIAAPPAGRSGHARIRRVEFAGGTSRVLVEPTATVGTSNGTGLMLWHRGLQPPAEGAGVDIVVQGTAHVLADHIG